MMKTFQGFVYPFPTFFLLYFHFWFSNFLANFKEKFVLVCVPYLLKKGEKNIDLSFVLMEIIFYLIKFSETFHIYSCFM